MERSGQIQRWEIKIYKMYGVRGSLGFWTAEKDGGAIYGKGIKFWGKHL